MSWLGGLDVFRRPIPRGQYLLPTVLFIRGSSLSILPSLTGRNILLQYGVT